MPALTGLGSYVTGHGSYVPDPIATLERGEEFGRNMYSNYATPGLAEKAQAGDEAALRELAIINPEALQNVLSAPSVQSQANTQVLQDEVTQERAKLIKLKENIGFVQGGDISQFHSRLTQLAENKKDDPDFVMQDIVELAKIAVTDPQKAHDLLGQELLNINTDLDVADQILSRMGGATNLQRGQGVITRIDGKEAIVTPVFDPRTGQVTNEVTQIPGTVLSREGETPEEKSARIAKQKGDEEAAKLAAKLETEPTLERDKAEAKETGKLTAQLDLKPQVEAAIEKAKVEAKARGETFTELARAKAGMPGLVEVANKLKGLADLATHTKGGKLWAVAVKEFGFGATKGATARATMTAIVDNQVLPLLRETFGAAFTKAEGDSLRATLLDVDSAPEIKKATLDAFIEQKYRNIEAKELELNAAQSTVNEDSQALEWAKANPNDPRSQTIMQSLGGK